MSKYIFDRNSQEQELLRLRLIEEALDPVTIAHLQSTGIRPGWRCLEVGAGAGSIASWMGNAVGEDGHVVAVDINTKHLGHLSSSNVRVVPGDFLETPVGNDFDLAHCRYVLIHNQRGQAMLERLVELVKPEGFLVVEEPDFTSAQMLNRDRDTSQRRVNNAICQMFEQMQLDPAYGLGLPGKMATVGLEIRHVDARLHLNRGGDALARMMAESAKALRDKYVATGEAGPTDIEAYITGALDPTCWGVYYSTVTVVAQKPQRPVPE